MTTCYEIRRDLICVRIAEKQSKSRVRHTLSVARLYRDGDVWKKSARFGRDDVPLLRLALDEAYQWLLEQQVAIDEKTITAI